MNTLILITCALCSLAGVSISYSKNSDPFSPIKIFTFFNVFFYFDIYLNTYSETVSVIYLIQCLIILVLAFFEPRLMISNSQSTPIKQRKAATIIWALTSVPVFNQIELINELGGLTQTISNIAYRVKYFEGKGYILVLNSFMIVLNLLLLQVTLKAKQFKYTATYGIHFSILVSIGLLSGSRSFIAMTALAACIIYNYQEKRINLKKLALAAITLSLLVGILGQLRNSVSTENNEITLEKFTDGKKLELSHFKYGLIPLEIVTSSELKNLRLF